MKLFFLPTIMYSLFNFLRFVQYRIKNLNEIAQQKRQNYYLEQRYLAGLCKEYNLQKASWL